LKEAGVEIVVQALKDDHALRAHVYNVAVDTSRAAVERVARRSAGLDLNVDDDGD